MPGRESQPMPARSNASCRLPPKSNGRRHPTMDRKKPFRKGKFRIGWPYTRGRDRLPRFDRDIDGHARGDACLRRHPRCGRPTLAAADLIRSEGKSAAFFSVLSFTVAGVNMPAVSVDPRNMFTRAVVGGMPSLELESDEFDKRFVVRAKDRRSAVMLLDPGMMQWLLDCDHVSFVMIGDRVLASINRATEPSHNPTEPVEFELLFKFYDGFMARLPAILRSEYATVQSPP